VNRASIARLRRLVEAVIDSDIVLGDIHRERGDVLLRLLDLEQQADQAFTMRAATVRDLLEGMRAAGANLPDDLARDVRALLTLDETTEASA
jgi:hypothetical protein